MIVYRPDFHYDFDGVPEYPEIFKFWIKDNCTDNCGDLSRLYLLFQNVNQVLQDGVPGDMVELGVYKGNSAKLLVTLAKRWGRDVFLFDTFESFDPRDFQSQDIDKIGVIQRFSDTSFESVREFVGCENVHFVRGYFPDSAVDMQLPRRISVAHIDCDLHDPIKAGLELFYPRVSTGGILVLHDYSSGHWQGAKRAIDNFFSDKPEKPILMPDKSGSAIIRRV
jgi:Macrocin-O-methyltransferase (TylF)